MPQHDTSHSTVIPGMSYRDAPKAIEWLCAVFGFEKHAVYPGPDSTILHAELTLGAGMIMLGSAKDGVAAKTPGINLIVEDADIICHRAKQAGATIVHDIEDKPYGGRAFTCRDAEGHTWNVGTYNPWNPK